MRIKHVILMVGTRPDAIKMAPLILRMVKNPAFKVTVISSGQHSTLLDQVLEEFHIVPDLKLNPRSSRNGLGDFVGPLIMQLEKVIRDLRPDALLGHGDTATCFGAAVASFHSQVPFVHVEAGLRSFDLGSPFPEEFYRQSISKIAALHFAPHLLAKENLLKEGIPVSKVIVTGNSISESLQLAMNSLPRVKEKPTVPFALITLHRREKLKPHFNNLKSVLRQHQDKQFLFFGHPNPNIKNLVDSSLAALPNVRLLLPQAYFQFISFLYNGKLVITDSGGVQEEATILKCPTIVYRDKSERELENKDSLLSLDPHEVSQAITTYFGRNTSPTKINCDDPPTLRMTDILMGAI